MRPCRALAGTLIAISMLAPTAAWAWPGDLLRLRLLERRADGPRQEVASAWSVATVVEQFEASARGGAVVLRWRLASVGSVQSVIVYRQDEFGTGFARLRGAHPSPGATGEFVDASAHPGALYRYRILLVAADGGQTASPVTSVRVPSASPVLLPNVPNPFQSQTKISFQLTEDAEATLEVFDVRGRRVRAFALQGLGPGLHNVTWDGRDQAGNRVGSGIYFCRLRSGDFVGMRKMAVIR